MLGAISLLTLAYVFAVLSPRSFSNVLGIGGGGAGNPGGIGGGATCSTGGTSQAPSGTGGIIFIIAKGNVKISSTGIISSNGTNGGSYVNIYDGGGASGAGVIMILHVGTYINNGTVQANGGTGGAGATGGGYGNGGTGGNGAIYQSQIAL